MVSHDLRTMLDHFGSRLAAGKTSPGLLLVSCSTAALQSDYVLEPDLRPLVVRGGFITTNGELRMSRPMSSTILRVADDPPGVRTTLPPTPFRTRNEGFVAQRDGNRPLNRDHQRASATVWVAQIDGAEKPPEC